MWPTSCRYTSPLSTIAWGAGRFSSRAKRRSPRLVRDFVLVEADFESDRPPQSTRLSGIGIRDEAQVHDQFVVQDELPRDLELGGRDGRRNLSERLAVDSHRRLAADAVEDDPHVLVGFEVCRLIERPPELGPARLSAEQRLPTGGQDD